MGSKISTLLKKYISKNKEVNEVKEIKETSEIKQTSEIKEIKEITNKDVQKPKRGRPKKKVTNEIKFLSKMPIDDLKRDLLAATYESTPSLNLNGYKGLCKIVDVYDGDTVHVAIEVFGGIYRIKCRLSGIDTAELVTNDPLEEEIANKAKKVVEQLTSNRLMWIVVHCNDKYGGRYVSTIYPDNTESKETSINQILLEQRLAYPYDGKKKKLFRQWYLLAKG